MRTIYPLSLSLAMTLTACSVMPKFHPSAQRCKKNDAASCTIAVTAVATDGGCTVSVSNNVLEVESGNDHVDLKWKLTSPGFQFAKFGVVLGDVDQLRPKSFSGDEVTWTDKNDDKKKYAYTVLVVKPLVSAESEYIKCTPLDPWIHNQ